MTSRARGYTPVDVLSVPKAQDIACGDDHSCARFDDGTVRCWGRNESGELGNGDRVESAVPLLVPGLD